MIHRLAVIGVGLIGGSLARDLRRLNLCTHIVGCSRNASNLSRAQDLGVIDGFTTNLREAVDGADMVLVASPLGAMAQVFNGIQSGLAADTVVTDVGSAKLKVIRDAQAAFGEGASQFVGAHPIAGTERSGVEASVDNLFDNRRVILTPELSTNPKALARVSDMWKAVGAEVVTMDPTRHDHVLAATSHLPHMLAYTLVDMLGRAEERVEMFRFAAGGFRDFTRIASSDPQMWHDICIANQGELVEVMRAFTETLDEACRAIEAGDGEKIKALFVRAKALRDKYAREHT